MRNNQTTLKKRWVGWTRFSFALDEHIYCVCVFEALLAFIYLFVTVHYKAFTLYMSFAMLYCNIVLTFELQ